METLSLLALISASQGFVLALMLFTQPFGHRMANQILAVFIGIHALRLSAYYIIFGGKLDDYPHVVLTLNLHNAQGPLLFFYIKALTQPAFRWRKVDFLHFIPVLVISIYAVSHALFSEDLVRTSAWWQGSPDEQLNTTITSFFVASALYFLAYVIVAAQRLKRHQHVIVGNFSNIEGKDLNWLWVIIGLKIIASIAAFVTQFLRFFTDIDIGPRQAYALLFTTVMIYILAFMGMRQKLIFTRTSNVDVEQRQDDLAEEDLADAPAPHITAFIDDSLSADELPDSGGGNGGGGKYEKSGLKPERREALWQQLQRLMDDDKPHLNADIKLADMAQMLDLPPNYLSQVINRRGEQNFFDFINHYRIVEAERLMREQPRESLLNIALDSGFNSQQAFSSRYKKMRRRTPSEFRRLKE